MDITFYFFFFVVLFTTALFFFYHWPLPQIDTRLMASTLHLLLGRSDSRHLQEEEQQRMGWVVGDFGAAQGVWAALKAEEESRARSMSRSD